MAGQSVGMVTSEQTTSEIIQELVQQASNFIEGGLMEERCSESRV